MYLWYPALPRRCDDDGHPTHTSREQKEVERRVDESQRYVLPRQAGKNKRANIFGGEDDNEGVDDAPLLNSCPALCELSFEAHAVYLLAGLMGNGCHSSLDASRPWLVYWSVHGLDVLDRLTDQLSAQMAQSVVRFLSRCVHPDGGMGGGPGQQAHTAPTYAAVMSLAILSSHPACADQALDVLRSARAGIYRFLMRCKVDNSRGPGGFRVSRDGEVDTRGAYTVLSVASLLNLLTADLTSGVGEWLASCQTYEGGMGGEPGNEAHGGYTFCGLAAAVLLRSTSRLDLGRLLKWAANRQMEREGGFQGRTNKLVDGCYSFWQGALFPMLHDLLQHEDTSSTGAATAAANSPAAAHAAAAADSSASAALPLPSSSSSSSGLLFDTVALQRYVLVSCQMAMGGLRDKPGKHADMYHSCYVLSGLAVSQHADQQQHAPLLGRRENLLVSTMDTHTCTSSCVCTRAAAAQRENSGPLRQALAWPPRPTRVHTTVAWPASAAAPSIRFSLRLPSMLLALLSLSSSVLLVLIAQANVHPVYNLRPAHVERVMHLFANEAI